MVMKQVCAASSQMKWHSGSRLAHRGRFNGGGRQGRGIHPSPNVGPRGGCRRPVAFSNNRHGIPLLQHSPVHHPLACLYTERVSRPCLVGCKAARDLLVQALTQTAGNLWPPARNLRGSELVLDRGIRMAAHYGCWGTRIWIVGCPYWGSFDMLKCHLPCSTDTDIYLASGLRRAESRTAGGNDTGLGNRAVMTRETVVAATGYYTEDGPERIGPE